MMTYEAMTAMTNAELSARMSELDYILMGDCTAEAWEAAYKERFQIVDILDERYKEANQAEFDAFYAKYIEGRSWEEIDPKAWEFYSDWHKDMYGFRPKHI